MLVANIKIWKSHLNIREGSDYSEGNPIEESIFLGALKHKENTYENTYR